MVLKNLINHNHHTGVINSFIMSTATGSLLIFVRVIYTKEFTFLFLLWNLFLAMIPLFISYFIELKSEFRKNNVKFMALLLFWLLFLPNAPYIITDYFHLYDRPGIPLWFDLIILTIFAWNGLIAAFISLLMMQNKITEKYNSKTGWFFVIIVLLVTSFGVYIGRYMRYNSWDVFLVPFMLFRDIGITLINPGQNKDAYGMTFGMGMFLLTAYLSFYRISKMQYKDVSKK